MKKHLLWIAPLAGGLLISVIEWRVRAQNLPVKLDDHDLLLYQRDRAEILLIQAQNKPLTDEFDQIISRWCSRASLPKASCTIDENTGLVSRIAEKK